MCKVQNQVYISIPVTFGNEESANVVVATNGNSDFEERRAKGRGESDRIRSSFRAAILLGAGFLALKFAASPCLCSFHSIGNDYSKGGVFMTGTALGILEPSIDIREPSMHYYSPPNNVKLRYAPLRPISPEASSIESPSEEEGYKLRKRGSSPSDNSKELDSGESSDSTGASAERNSSEDDNYAGSVAPNKVVLHKGPSHRWRMHHQ